jgi:hypothetical protein
MSAKLLRPLGSSALRLLAALKTVACVFLNAAATRRESVRISGDTKFLISFFISDISVVGICIITSVK